MELTFTVHVQEHKASKPTFADLIKDEITEDNRQKEITYAINRETTKAHAKALDVILAKLNSELEGLNIEFKRSPIGMETSQTNHYIRPYAILKLGFNNFSWGIRLNGKNTPHFELSKYTTFCGEYNIQIVRLASPCWTANPSFYNVGSIEDILKEIKDDVKSYVAN